MIRKISDSKSKTPASARVLVCKCLQVERHENYLTERRRALMRARAETKNALAEPTTARTAVGFSGELVQPVCAWRGRAMERKSAKPANVSVDLFIDGLQ
jgi:hypothetical protein